VENIYEALRKAENIIISQKEEKLIDFLKQFYEITDIDGGTDPENTLYYAEEIDANAVYKIRCRYIWSAAIMNPEIRKMLPEDKIVVEGRNIKDEYIARFLGNCSI
jgi:hypothetical protein